MYTSLKEPIDRGVEFEIYEDQNSIQPSARMIVTDSFPPVFTYQNRTEMLESFPGDSEYMSICEFIKRILERRFNVTVVWY